MTSSPPLETGTTTMCYTGGASLLGVFWSARFCHQHDAEGLLSRRAKCSGGNASCCTCLGGDFELEQGAWSVPQACLWPCPGKRCRLLSSMHAHMHACTHAQIDSVVRQGSCEAALAGDNRTSCPPPPSPPPPHPPPPTPSAPITFFFVILLHSSSLFCFILLRYREGGVRCVCLLPSSPSSPLPLVVLQAQTVPSACSQELTLNITLLSSAAMFCLYMQITAQQAVQMLIELQQATQPEHDVIASPKGGQSPAESTQTAMGLEPRVVSSAAKQILQNLAEQHSCKCQPIFTDSHVQQLLQPSLEAFCQPQKTTRLKGSAPSAEGSAPAVKGSTPAVTGRAYDAMGNAAVVKGTLTPREGAVTPSEGECLPLVVETVNGDIDAAGISAHDWQKLRYGGAQKGTDFSNSEPASTYTCTCKCLQQNACRSAHHTWM